MRNEILGVISFHNFSLSYKFGNFLKAKKLPAHRNVVAHFQRWMRDLVRFRKFLEATQLQNTWSNIHIYPLLQGLMKECGI